MENVDPEQAVQAEESAITREDALIAIEIIKKAFESRPFIKERGYLARSSWLYLGNSD